MNAISYAEIGRHDVKGPSGEGWHSALDRAPSTWHRAATPRTHEPNAPVDAVNTSRRIRRSCHVFSRRVRRNVSTTFRCSEAISEGRREGFRIPLAPLEEIRPDFGRNRVQLFAREFERLPDVLTLSYGSRKQC
jgi:hypothetical protein